MVTAPPVVPAKEMTDEELKKIHGIHLASRIQTEDAGKESTWADEDDDEDWVPETIEWNDGTKVALQLEPAIPTPTAAAPAPISASIPPVPQAPEVASSQRVPEKPSEPKTLVFTRDSNKGIENPDKGTKDAPLPRASPWATLPPPNTVQLLGPRSESRASDFSGSQGNVGSREVHVDDFNRPWRDRPMNNQLYNSQTGQLEPVQDRSRVLRNPRAELQLGKTQVLQRPPSQLSGPAEPSPAFQQTRAGAYRQDEYRRRRTSSNVSGGSGSTGRRLSFSKAMYNPEYPLNPEESVYSSRHLFSGAPPMQPESQSAHVGNGPLIPQSAIPTNTQNETFIIPSEDFEDPIAKQQRIMKETRELARKRKQEEEAKEEAARKERLRLKLEALEKEAEAKAARTAAEAEKAADASQLAAAAEAARLVPMMVGSPVTTDSSDTRCQYNSNIAQTTSTIDLPNPPHHHSLISPQQQQLPNTTQNSFHTSAVLHQSSTQPHSLASIPYRPGSFGNRSPTKKFSTLQPSAQSSINSTNTYNIPIRDPRHDPSLNSRLDSESLRWSQKTNPRASPYGSIGDRSKYPASSDTRNSTFVHQQYSSQNIITENPQETKDNILAAPGSLLNPEKIHPQPEGDATTPRATERTPEQVNKPIPLPTKVDGQAMPRPGRHNAHTSHSVTTTEKVYNPWASYPEQLQREEERDKRIAREKNREIVGFRVAGEVIEQWTQRPTDAEDHRGSVHTNSIPTGPSSAQYPPRSINSTSSPVNGPGPISKPPSSPPPAEFCPVIALDMNSDEDSHKGRTGAQPKKLVPFVRLPPPPSRAMETLPFSTSDGYNRQESPRLPDVTRYDRVLGSILKTIEVSKGHQSSSSTSSAAPPKFSETKPVYTDDRESQQQSLTTVSLPPRIDHATAVAEPEDSCTNDEEDFLQRLYVQEFGSQPTVKIPVIFQNSTFSPPRPLNSKTKKPTRPKGFAESVPLFEVVGLDDLVNEQGLPFIPVRVGPDSETKKVVIQGGWPKLVRRESRKNAGYTNNNNSSRKPGANNGYFKKEAKPFMNQRQRMQSPSGPKPIQLHTWERQHPVV